jgi:hypothetical protein
VAFAPSSDVMAEVLFELKLLASELTLVHVH